MSETVATLKAYLGADIGDFQRGMNEARGNLSKFGNALGKSVEGVRQFTEKATRMSAPIAAVFGLGIKVASDFETAMTEVQARTGLTAAEMKKVGDFALEMGAKTLFSGGQAAEGLLQLLSSGQDVKEAMATLPAVMNAAAAGSIELGLAADAVTDIMGAFGLGVKDAGKVVQALTAASGASSATMSDMIEAYANVGAAAKDFNLSVEDTAAIFAVWAETGLKGAEAGTQLRSMLTNMSRNTGDVIGAWKDLGTSLYDMTGKMRPLEEVIDDLNRAMDGMSDEDRNYYIQTLAGSYGKLGLSALLAAGGTDTMTKKMQAVPDAAEIAAGKMNTFQQKLEALKGSAEAVAVKAFTPLMDALGPVVKELEASANSVGDWIEKNPQLAGDIVKLGAVMLIAMPALNLFATTLTNIAVLVQAGGTLITGIAGLVVALGPLGVAFGVVAGAGALAVAVIKDAQNILSKLSAPDFVARNAEVRMERYKNDTQNYALEGRKEPGGLTKDQVMSMISAGIDPQSLSSFDPKLDMNNRAFQWTGDTTPAAYGKAIALVTAEYSGAAEAERKRWQSWADRFAIRSPGKDFHRDFSAEERQPPHRQLQYNPNFASTSDKVRDAMIGVVGLAPEATAVIKAGVPPAPGLWEKLSVSPNVVEWSKVRAEIVILVSMAAASVMAGAAEGAGAGRATGGVQTAPRRAAGGPVGSGRTYLVGELGPELFVPRERGTILPGGRGEGGGRTIFNVTIFGNHDPAVLYEKWRREARRRNNK